MMEHILFHDVILNIFNYLGLIDLIYITYMCRKMMMHMHYNMIEYVHIRSAFYHRYKNRRSLLNLLRTALKVKSVRNDNNRLWVCWQIFDILISRSVKQHQIRAQAVALMYRYHPLNSDHKFAHNLNHMPGDMIGLYLCHCAIRRNSDYGFTVDCIQAPLTESAYLCRIQPSLEFIRCARNSHNLTISAYLKLMPGLPEKRFIITDKIYNVKETAIASISPAKQEYLKTFTQLWKLPGRAAYGSIYNLLQHVVQKGDLEGLEYICYITDWQMYTDLSLFKTACYHGQLEIAKWLWSHCDAQQICPCVIFMRHYFKGKQFNFGVLLTKGYIEILDYLLSLWDFTMLYTYRHMCTVHSLHKWVYAHPPSVNLQQHIGLCLK
jgi:hypothetical protein